MALKQMSVEKMVLKQMLLEPMLPEQKDARTIVRTNVVRTNAARKMFLVKKLFEHMSEINVVRNIFRTDFLRTTIAITNAFKCQENFFGTNFVTTNFVRTNFVTTNESSPLEINKPTQY